MAGWPWLRAAEIPAVIHHQYIKPLLEQRDEWKQRVAPRLALEQIVRCHVGRGHDHDASVEQCLEQPPQEPRVRNVVHLEFIEAEQRRFRRDGIGERRDRIGAKCDRGLTAQRIYQDLVAEHGFVGT